MHTSWRWGALLLLVLSGCSPGTPEARARGQLQKAYLEAARGHAGVIAGDFTGAEKAIGNLRGALEEAQRQGPSDLQGRLDLLARSAAAVEQEVQARDPEAYRATLRLMSQTHDVYASLAPIALAPAGGGGGGKAARAAELHPAWELDP